MSFPENGLCHAREGYQIGYTNEGSQNEGYQNEVIPMRVPCLSPMTLAMTLRIVDSMKSVYPCLWWLIGENLLKQLSQQPIFRRVSHFHMYPSSLYILPPIDHGLKNDLESSLEILILTRIRPIHMRQCQNSAVYVGYDKSAFPYDSK